ncbi:MAG: LysR family transcriptional regulator [Lachnospiraceae bacterium]
MTQKELLYVKTVADEKSISKAAKLLFIAQPSLSQSIQRIEDNLGTLLFNRVSGGLTLTYAGERYYNTATQILKMYENFEIEISDINNLKTGRIHLGTTNHLGTLVLPRILPRFYELCPYIELFITEDTSQVLEQKLLARQLDFAIMHAPKERTISQIRYELLSQDPFVIVLAPGHPLLAQAVPKSGYDYPVLDVRLLQDEPFIMLHKQQRIRQVCNAVLQRAGIRQPEIRFTLKNYETAQLLAAQGLGVTMVPQQYASIASSGYQPTFCSIDRVYDASWDMCIATLNSNYQSRADQLFIQTAKEIITA